jgi:hypothetical protein
MDSTTLSTLLFTGIACVIAAIIGGGLKAFNIEMPVFSSVKRQALLSFVGALLIIFYFIKSPAKPEPNESKKEVTHEAVHEVLNEVEITNRWKTLLENKNIEGLLHQSGIPFTFQNQFVGDKAKLREKYTQFFQTKHDFFSKPYQTMIFAGGGVRDSVIMHKGLYNDAFQNTRDAILHKMASTTPVRDKDYFMLWNYFSEPVQLPFNGLQCSVLLRGPDSSKLKVIAFSYE